ncbi:MAG: hypothetical protein IPN53_08155 [Comamonadaceae bacterium]|nr:hypothetical protein [Comamonadaceae bacterium]
MNANAPIRTASISVQRRPEWQGSKLSEANLITVAEIARSHARAVGKLMASLTAKGCAAAERGSADACLMAFVDSRLLLADQLLNEEGLDSAADCLAETHQTLLFILQHAPRPSGSYQSALWHSRRTHCALLSYVQEFGSHMAIEGAFRAGCLTLAQTPTAAYPNMS